MLTLVLSFSLNANTLDSSFQANSKLPEPIQEKMLKTIDNDFPCLKVDSLKEQETKHTTYHVDQGMLDHFYTTTFKAEAYLDDYYTSSINLEVVAVQSSVFHTDFERFQIRKIDADASCF